MTDGVRVVGVTISRCSGSGIFVDSKLSGGHTTLVETEVNRTCVVVG